MAFQIVGEVNMLSVEAKLNEALAQVAELQTALSNSRIDAAYFERELRMTNAGLRHEAKIRLHKAFERSTDNAGLREAINTEKRRYQR